MSCCGQPRKRTVPVDTAKRPDDAVGAESIKEEVPANSPLLPSGRETRPHVNPEHAKQMEKSRQRNHERHEQAVENAQRTRTALAMCFLCPARDGARCSLVRGSHANAKNLVLNTGTIKALPRAGDVQLIVSARASVQCPRNRHPVGEHQIVRWMGLAWYGVPEPLRWLLDIRRGPWRGTNTLVQCGCQTTLKALSLRKRFEWLAVALERVPAWRRSLGRHGVFKRSRGRIRFAAYEMAMLVIWRLDVLGRRSQQWIDELG